MSADPSAIRNHLYDALYADLVGPFAGASAHGESRELLPLKATSWYLTGFLVPEGDREKEPDTLDGPGEGDDIPAEEAAGEEQEPRQRKLFPASMGVSVLLPGNDSLKHVTAEISFASTSLNGSRKRGRRFGAAR